MSKDLSKIRYFNSILETIGNTPLIKLNRINKGLKPHIFVKVETFNPGGSIKDRIGIEIIEDAERTGRIKPGGTIVESTSGNTGMGLAMAAIIKGYKCIFTTTDKQSKEKVDALRAFGAEVIVCPTNVDPEDPRSYIQFLLVWNAKCRIHGNLINTIISQIQLLIMSKQVLKFGNKQKGKLHTSL